MQTRNLIFAFGFTSLCIAPASGGDNQALTFHRHARSEARLLPCQPLGERAIRVDGDLSEWDMTSDSFPIHQLLDHTVPGFHQSWKRAWERNATDAALIKLLHSKDALFIAVKVADSSVVSPPDEGKRLHGDVVDIYLDLRPAAGRGPLMGHVKYTEGIYQLVFAPPSTAVPIHILQPENEMFTGWRAGQKVPRLGSFEANASLFKGGYSIEIRLPLASFPHKPASDRLNRPFGFEVMIADKDTGRPKGQPDRMYYSCSGYSGGGNYFKSPSTIACTDPELRTSLPLSRLRNNPLKNAPGGDECEGWIVTALNEQNVDSAFVQASGDVKGFVPSETQDKDRPFTTYPCPALGIAFHHRRVLDRLPALSPSTVGNRYLGVFPAGRQEIKVDGSLDDWDDFEKTAAVIHEYGCMPWCAGIEGKNDSASIKLMTANDTLYLFEEVRIWQQMLSELRPGAAMIRQFVSEKSNKWLMVHGQNFVKDRYGIPEVKISFFSDAAEGVLPTQRFWITKQFCDLTPTGNALQTSSDHPQVLVSGFSGKQGFRKVYTIHAANIGAARKAELIGLPKIKEMHIVRTTGGEGAHRVDDLKVKSGRIELDLPAWSLVTLTTMPPKTWDGP